MAKKIVILMLLLTASGFWGTLSAQIIKGEAIVGMNLSQVDGDMFYGFKKFGGQMGVGAMVPLGENFDVSIETLFNQKGSRQRSRVYDSICIYDYKLQLNYAEVPVMIHYTDKQFITAGVGFSWGRLVGASEWQNGIKTATNVKSGTYLINDYNLLAGVRIRIKGPLKFNIRYAYSLASLRTREFTNCDSGTKFTRKQYNNLISFRLVYIFGEAASKENLIKSKTATR